MEYDLTPQRQAYLDARGHTILTACPGSGKPQVLLRNYVWYRNIVQNIMENIPVLLVFRLLIKPVQS